jgi:formylglycine-generating enzyme required for sulfatase activity
MRNSRLLPNVTVRAIAALTMTQEKNMSLRWSSGKRLGAACAMLFGWGTTTVCNATGDLPDCPVNMVPVGPLCVDQYEASVWSRPPTSNGKPKGRQFGLVVGDYPCSIDGNDCAGKIFAASVRGVMPAVITTWFQAQQACIAVGKRLPTNAEWQAAAAGTPDTGDADDHVRTCNTDGLPFDQVPTGSRRRCVSSYGVYDMIGNVSELVADWIQGGSRPWRPTENLNLPTDPDRAGDDFGQDIMRGINPAPLGPEGSVFPAAIVRGGAVASGDHGEGAGVFALTALRSPAAGGAGEGPNGFRCVR